MSPRRRRQVFGEQAALERRTWRTNSSSKGWGFFLPRRPCPEEGSIYDLCGTFLETLGRPSGLPPPRRRRLFAREAPAAPPGLPDTSRAGASPARRPTAGLPWRVAFGFVAALPHGAPRCRAPGPGLLDPTRSRRPMSRMQPSREGVPCRDHGRERPGGRRGALVLDDLHGQPRADDLVPLLDVLDAPDSSRRSVEFRAKPPGCGSGFPNMTPILVRSWLMTMRQVWVREMELVTCAGLAHEPSLQAHVLVSHLALDSAWAPSAGPSPRDDVERAGAHRRSVIS